MSRCIALTLFAATPAFAGVGGSVVPSFPTPLFVGDAKTATITITNRATSPNDSENVNVSGIFLTPSCAASDGFTCSEADPGVFQFSSAAGRSGSSCAGVVFSLGPPNPATGQIELIPPVNNPVVLGPSNGAGPKPKQCVIAINFRVIKPPLDSTPGDSTLTTDSLAHASLESAVTGNAGAASGGGTTAISDPNQGADQTPPTISITSPTSGSTWSTSSASVVLGGTAADNVGVMSVTWANAATSAGGPASGLTSWSGAVPLVSGNNAITMTARDAAGNTGTATLTVTYTPIGAPTAGAVTASSIQFGTFVSSPFNLSTSFNSSNPVTGCEYTTNSSTWLAATVSGAAPNFTCTKNGITGNDGQVLTLNMRATNAGGTGTANAISRTVDAAAPVTSSNAPSAWVGTNQTITLSPGDGSGSGAANTQYCTDAGNSCTPGTNGTSVSVNCGAGSNCQTYVRFRSTDNIGNVEAIKSALVRIDRSNPSNGSLNATPNGSQVVVGWSGITDTGSGLAAAAPYKLVFSTSGIPSASCTSGTVLLNGTATSYTHTGLTNGTTYYYRVCATDAVGNVSSGATDNAKVQFSNQPPVADAGPDKSGQTGVAVSFNGSGSTDPDGTISTYAWTFGDGGSASGVSVSHAYASAGTYTVTLTVTDNQGAQDNDTAVVTITNLVQPTGNYLWGKRFGGSASSAAGYATATDASGNVNVTGEFSGTVDFGGGNRVSAGATDIFLVKYAAGTGAHLWSKRFGGTSNDTAMGVAVDPSGNVYIVGSFKGTVDFGGGPLSAYYNGFGSATSDFFIAKFSSTGTHLWSKSFGAAGEDIANGVAVNASGEVLVTGSFRNQVDFGGTLLNSTNSSYDIFLAKYSSAGQLIWAQKFGGISTDTANGVAVDSNGNIFLTGSFSGTVDFGGGALVASGSLSDAFLAKFTSAGAHVWSKRFGDNVQDAGYQVAVDGAGNVAVTGYFQGSVDFGGGSIVSQGVLDVFVAKYSPTGAHIWSRGIGGSDADEGYGLAMDAAGNAFVVGTFQNQINAGTGPINAVGSWDILVAKYAPDGTPLWAKAFGSGGDDIAYAITTDANGNATKVGVFQGTVNFGGGPWTAAGWSDLFVVNLAP